MGWENVDEVLVLVFYVFTTKKVNIILRIENNSLLLQSKQLKLYNYEETITFTRNDFATIGS
jgi:hypothetical protein